MKKFLKMAILAVVSAVFLAMMTLISYFVVTSFMKALHPTESKPMATQISPIEKPNKDMILESTPTSATPTGAFPDESEPQDDVTSEEEYGWITTQEIMYTCKTINVYVEPDKESMLLGTIPAGKEVLAIQTYPDGDSNLWDMDESDIDVIESNVEVTIDNEYVMVVYGNLSGYTELVNLSYEEPQNISINVIEDEFT